MSLGLGLKFYDKKYLYQAYARLSISSKGQKRTHWKVEGQAFLWQIQTPFINCPLLFSRLLTESVFGIKSYYNPEMKNEWFMLNRSRQRRQISRRCECDRCYISLEHHNLTSHHGRHNATDSFFLQFSQWCLNVNLPCTVVFFLMFCPSFLRGAGLGRSMSLNHKNEGWHPLPRDLTANTR